MAMVHSVAGTAYMRWRVRTVTAAMNKGDGGGDGWVLCSMQKHVWIQLLCMASSVGIFAISASQTDDLSLAALLVALAPFFVFGVYVFMIME